MDARKREERALAITTTVKFIQIVNSLVGLWTHVEACFVATDGEKMQPWQRLIPMVGPSDEGNIRFNDNEITLLARAKQSDLMQELLLLAIRHSSALVAWQDYCRRRDNLAEQGPKPTSFEGERGSAKLSSERATELKVYTIPLNNLAVGCRAHLADDVELARKISGDLSRAYDEYFGVKDIVSLSFPSEHELADRIRMAAESLQARK